MQKKMKQFSFWLFILIVAQVSISAQEPAHDWNQFRGSDRNGIYPEKGLLTEWPENGPELLWKKKITDSFSEVVISDNILFTCCSDTLESPGSEYVAAYKIENGEEIWKTRIDSIFIDPDGWGNGPRSTPYVDENLVFAQSSFGKLIAVDKLTGELKWQLDFMKEFGTIRPRWGYARTISIVGDIIFAFTGGTEGKAFAGINKKTGKVVWTTGKGDFESYSSPLVVNIDGATNIVMAHDTMLTSLNEKGEVLWTYRMPTVAGNSMPVFVEPNKFFVSRVSRVGSFLIEVNGKEAKPVWDNPTMQCNWSTPVYYNGYIYGFGKSSLQCISIEDGNAIWSKRGYGKGSAILVDGKLIAITERGTMNLVEATPEAYIEKGSFLAIDGKSWTAPSFYDGKVFLRNLTEMVAYKLK